MASTNDMLERARHYATEAHGRIDQRRKYTGQSYDVHLQRVAEIVATVTDDAEMLAAAWLHDTVEDTPATFQDIEREFGSGVLELVTELTDVSRPSDGNRAARKAIDCEHLAQASPRAQTVKLADLIDNCMDVVRHDERFGRVFLVEMRALLDVLGQGDAALMKRARKVLGKGAAALGLELTSAPRAWPDPPPDAFGDHRAWRSFARAFSARDVAEPLRSFDAVCSAPDVAEQLKALGVDVAGVRRDGEVVAYVRVGDLVHGTVGEAARPFARDQIVDAESSLTEVIGVLTRYQHGFVRALSSVAGTVTRRDVEKPIARMWLFGMITLVELQLVERIRQRWPDGSWEALVPAARLGKARELNGERSRRGQTCELLDCLQLGDKAGILISAPEELAWLGFDSRKAAKRVVKEFESLRNNLAHAQDIVTHDWAQIARMTARIDGI